MSAAEETIETPQVARPKSVPILNRVLDFLSSVRFGVVQLCILVVLAMAGMLILQQNVEGFEAYYVSLTPAEKTVYGALGLFDIYHSWYFNAMLLLLSLNIILASIDRFPSAWKYLVKPKVTATRDWLLSQKQHAVIERSDNEAAAIETIKSVFRTNGFKPVVNQMTTKEYGVNDMGERDFSVVRDRTSTVVFGETGKINRIGAYIVHVALLTLFLGNFVFFTTSFDADIRMRPGVTTDKILLITQKLDKKKSMMSNFPSRSSAQISSRR